MKIKHSNGETYEGIVVNVDQYRIWLKIKTGRILCIMKMDIHSRS